MLHLSAVLPSADEGLDEEDLILAVLQASLKEVLCNHLKAAYKDKISRAPIPTLANPMQACPSLLICVP